MKLKGKLHWLLYALLLLPACARQTSPTGGPKDSIPPILIKSLPAPEQTNYKEQSIELTFNEALLLNNPKEQIIITPSVGKEFDAEVNKNKLVITIKSKLSDSTTYAINLREAVQDITEKNPAQNIKLAFSTGPYVDSLSIEGLIYDLLSSKEVKDATVALYQSDTFNIFKHKPSYITKTDLKGKFQIGNLKPGNYHIYAFEDRNKNLIVDSKSEAYGFRASTLPLDANIKTALIGLIRLDARPLKLTGARPSGTYFNIKASKNLTSYKITNKESVPIIASFTEGDHANIQVYNTLDQRDSLQLTFSAQDSMHNAIDTTFYLKFTKREAKADAFKAANAGFKVTGTKGLIEGSISFNKPIIKINFDSIYYQIDSANIIKLTQSDMTLDTTVNLLTIKKTFDKNLLIKKETPKTKPPTQPTPQPNQKPNSKDKPIVRKNTDNQLYIAPHSFISIELDSSKAISETIQPSTLEKTGIIIAEIKTSEKNYVTQLLTKDLKIIRHTTNSPKSTFEDLDPGEYLLRLIIDTNADGKWSPGNFLNHQEPEPIKFYKNEKGTTGLPLKANWETGPYLITY